MQMRKQLVAEEFAAAKAEASDAKAERDKARQKAAGEMIRSLKQEMAQLGEDLSGHSQVPCQGAAQGSSELMTEPGNHERGDEL